MNSSTWTYVGVLDDVAMRFPWNFKLTPDRLKHLLIVEMLHGKPLLLNDGYLTHHPWCQQALLTREGLLWELLQAGFVGVMARGGQSYTLDEMPGRMAGNVPSFGKLIRNEVPGVEWPALKSRLSDLDGSLRRDGHLLAWPRYQAGSGFLVLAERLLARGASPHSLGIGRHVDRRALSTFLARFVERMHGNLEGARSYWEALAQEMADNPDVTNRPAEFMRALMNLANELYHYNMGLMLSASESARISVQTQTSPAFDDLLFPPALKFLARDISHAPRLHVPAAITSVDPRVLVRILRPQSQRDERLAATRAGWLQLREAWETAEPQRRPAIEPELKLAGRQYSAYLKEHLGTAVKYRETEALLDYVLDKSIDRAIELAPAVVGYSTLGIPGAVAGLVAGAAIGYAVSRAKKNAVGSVVRKFRVELFDQQLKISPRAAEQSRKVLNIIKRRATPSTIELPQNVAALFARSLQQV